MIELGHEKVRFYTNPNCFNGAHGAEALEGYRLEPYGFWMAKFDRTPEDVGVYNGVTVVGKQWGNNDMKPDNIAWIPNIDVSTFYLDDIEEAQTESTAGWTRQQAERTVSGLYEGVLHRGYGEGENEGLVQGLVGDMTRVQAFDSVRESDEYRKKQLIIDCYRFMRGCDPSPDELNAWLGDDEENIKNNILYSEEFNTRYGV
jgi:hypothetical protein